MGDPATAAGHFGCISCRWSVDEPDDVAVRMTLIAACENCVSADYTVCVIEGWFDVVSCHVSAAGGSENATKNPEG